jgi:hypothetical protein
MVQTSPSLARYASDWGRKGDLGYAGFVNGRCIGAAWLRLWPEDDHGFGYVADDIPELAFPGFLTTPVPRSSIAL